MRTDTDHIFDLATAFGTSPGDDGVLIDWDEMCEWFDAVAAISPHLSIQTIGDSTEGRPLKLIVASSPETIRNLDAVADARAALRYPDHLLVGDPTAAGSKPVVLITAGIHATEVGGPQLMPGFVRDLARYPRHHDLLEKVILLIVPTLNPDGMDLVHRWYRDTKGTPAEGTAPPALYHRYAGHDNNRDWYQQHLPETRVVVDEVLRVWYPHVVIDLHQMGHTAPRYVLPPYIDPVEPHVHPLTHALTNELGSQIALAHLRAGHEGVCSGVMFDCYSLTRAWMHYHGGVRILAEAASAGIASPVSLKPDQVHLWDDVSPTSPSSHMPLPWRGGTWALADIIRLHRITIDTVIAHVASRPTRWLHDQWQMVRDQVQGADFGYWVIAPLAHQTDPAAARELIEILQHGDVRVDVAVDDNGPVRAGSLLVHRQQPFGSYAAALLEHTPYPEGAQAYDVTSHYLPLHMGVEVQYLPGTFGGGTRLATDADLSPFRPAEAQEIRAGAWLVIDSRSAASIHLVNHALRTGSRVARLQRPAVSGRRMLAAGSWIVTDGSIWDVKAHAARMHVRTTVIDPLAGELLTVTAPRIGLYDPQHVSASDFGWLRLWLERAGFGFTVVTGEDIIHGALDRIDALLIPHAKPDHLLRPHDGGAYPTQYRQGLSERVAATMRTWTHRGGHLIAFEGAVAAVCERLKIDLDQPLVNTSARSFASSGAVVRIEPALGDELIVGIEEPFPVMYFSPWGFEVRDTGSQHSVARFARVSTVLSGTMRGEKQLAGKHAVVQMTMSEGHFTAFAFRPHFRTQMLASEAILVNAIMQFGARNR